MSSYSLYQDIDVRSLEDFQMQMLYGLPRHAAALTARTVHELLFVTRETARIVVRIHQKNIVVEGAVLVNSVLKKHFTRKTLKLSLTKTTSPATIA